MTNINIINPTTGQTGYQVPGAPIPSGWLSSGATAPASLVKDPATGVYGSSAGTTGPNMVPIPTPTSKDPYTIFNQNMGNMIAQITNAQTQGNTKLGGQSDYLSGLSVNPNNSTFNPSVFSGSQVQNQSNLQNSFNPAITSINTQMDVTNKNLENLKGDITAASTLYQPQAISPGQSLVTKDGTVLARAPNWQYNVINPFTGKLDNYDSANNIYGSDLINPSTKGATAIADNNNPLNIKLTATTTKMFESLGASTGSTASDGGNFVHFNTPADGIKAARMLLQSPLYANDSVDQALRAWSNNGYNSSILGGTGINPHALIKDLDPVQLDTMMASMRQAEGGTQNQGANTTSNQPIVQGIATQVANGTISYNDGYSQISSIPQVGAFLANQLLPAVQQIKPDFNVNQANAQAAAQASNTKLAGDTAALVDKTNQTLDLLPDAYDQLGTFQKLGGSLVSGKANLFSDVSGIGKAETDNYQRILAEARASANAVLSTAANLGVVTGGKTADSLLPDNMSRAGLMTAISTIKDLEEKTKNALAKISNASAGSNVSSNSGDYAAYLKAIGK